MDDPTVLEFRLPDLGEGLADADLVAWTVAVGDRVELNQTIAEVETAKATVELPSPFSGTVTELLVSPGDTVPVGAPIIRVASDYVEPAAQAPQQTDEKQPVLVGYGPSAEPVSRRPKRPGGPSETASDHIDAKPSARKLAGELGIDLYEVPGTGYSGAITVEDVRAYENSPGIPSATDPTIAKRETREPIAGIRKRTAEAMVSSVRTAPHVTEFITVDVTASVDLLEHLRTTTSFKNLKLTPLALVAKTALVALADNPSLNSVWDEDNREIVTKHYVNLGIAVATGRGLMVPSIKEAQGMSLRELSREIGWLTETTRLGDATPADLRGGTFSITNVGVFGVDAGTPIINPGEAAILCLGAITKRPWVVHDQVVPRWVTTLSLSFDHRLVDGEQGSKFLAQVAAMLEDPAMLLGAV